MSRATWIGIGLLGCAVLLGFQSSARASEASDRADAVENAAIDVITSALGNPMGPVLTVCKPLLKWTAKKQQHSGHVTMTGSTAGHKSLTDTEE